MPKTRNIDKYLQNKIFPDLEKGRPNRDKPHTIAVVQYLKDILNNCPELKLDKEVLLISAYLHDWGYVGLFKNKESPKFDDVKDAKTTHMKIGAGKTSKLLKNDFFNFLSRKQKSRIIHLVGVHDNLSKLKDVDEIILMEADTLGALDVSKVKPDFDAESNERYIQGVLKIRFSKFITEHGKNKFERLIKEREEYYKKITS